MLHNDINRPQTSGKSMSIDLHGMSVKQAKQTVKDAFDQAQAEQVDDLTVVTGIGRHVNANGSRGVLFKALPKWLKTPALNVYVKNVKQDMGAYEIRFKGFDDCDEYIKELNDGVFSHLPPQQLNAQLLQLERNAERGDTESQAVLGSMYVNGIAVKQDFDKGIPWLQKAAENSAEVQAQLGAIYSSSHFTIKNYTIAYNWYLKAAQQKNSDALFSLGKMLWLGRGVIKSHANDIKAIQYLAQSAELGNSGAALSLADIYFHGVDKVARDLVLANKFYHIAANAGSVSAELNLGKQYFFGWGVEQSDINALLWFEKAAASKDATAQYYMGFIFEHGRSVPVDLVRAAVWYKRSALNGDLDSQFNIAYWHLLGITYKKDIDEALRQLSVLATKKHANSLFLLGEILCSTGPKQDISRAIESIIAASELGQSDAQKTLAELYLSGEYASLISAEIFKKMVNSIESSDCLACKAAVENDQAQFDLAIYYTRDSDPIDHDKAFYYYQKAAKQDNVDAVTGLAYCYLGGRGVKADNNQALFYFEKAATLGDKLARKNLISLLQNSDNNGVLSEKTLHWLSLAALDGELYAQFALGRNGVTSSFARNEADADHAKFADGVYWLYQACLQGDKGAIHFFNLTCAKGHGHATQQVLSAEYLRRHGTSSIPPMPTLNGTPSVNTHSSLFNSTNATQSNYSNAASAGNNTKAKHKY